MEFLRKQSVDAINRINELNIKNPMIPKFNEKVSNELAVFKMQIRAGCYEYTMMNRNILKSYMGVNARRGFLCE